ncbi:ATP-binding cassette multidrug transport protein ATRC [Cordyceps fumosorosea ARSEF 2679]|uniref:ATP-binding cassette multidrug transport protein ATRC n=1 Tax=Cordyceps fumosorosea (strain ARSEF 2679) TaxID=1081104 RepID=A0A167RMQ8_CORFA|nr:ATP-binding cassette multidrug transport protein ATRC [Cordyceps fumosorosea ARSEF 2679]OAA58748.1 ATP-binding cassette multidrug transport protein ATRC [Cordyceps fumosorosea ARSEF 2679]
MEAPGKPEAIATKLDEKARPSQDSESQPEPSSGNAYFQAGQLTKGGHPQRIFTHATSFEYTLQGIAIFAAICSGAGIALQNLIFGNFVTTMTSFANGKATPGDFQSEASKLALYFVYLGIARFVLSYIYNSLLTYTSYRVVRNLRSAYLGAALRQEVAFFDLGAGSASIAAAATTNGRLVQGGISEKLGLTFQGLSAFVTAFVIAFATHWKLTLITLCVAPAILVVMGVVSALEAAIETRILDIHAQANAFAEGVLASARTVHAFEMRERLVGKFDGLLKEAHGLGDKNSVLFGALFSTEYTIVYLGFGLAFWQGVNMLARGEIQNPGQIFTVLLSVVIAAISLTNLAPYLIEFTRAATGASQMFALIDRKSSIDSFSEAGEKPTETQGDIQIDNVTFAYPTRPDTVVLNDFSLHIPAGKVTALVGQSGSGKSTIVGLIERWYDPLSGSIKLDGRPITDLNLNWLRKNVRLVQQEPILFQGSVYDNIANGLVGTPWEHAPRAEKLALVQEAATTAFAHDFILALPSGYDTDIGQRGGLLSGGQRQRVAIARSVVSRPAVLLLDEATSALDPHAEGVVQQALDRASKGRTTITIAHKLATIRRADNIVVMAGGRIVEQGTHEALLAREGGAYANLVSIQDLAVTAAAEEGSDGEESDRTANGEEGGRGGGSDPADAELQRTLTRQATEVQQRMETQKDRDSYDKHKPLGMVAAIIRLVRESPDLTWAYLLTVVGCMGASAGFPGQAILVANTVQVFTLTGQAMVDRGNFFASMFVVLAAGCLVFYFILGWTTNTIAQSLSHRFRRQSLDDMLRQDLQFFDRPENSTGALTSRVDGNPQSILELMGINVGLIFVAVLNVLGCSALAVAYSWRLGLVVVCAGMPPLLASGWLKIRSDARLDDQLSRRHSRSAAIASEAVTAIRTVSSLAIEAAVLDRYTGELDRAVAGSVRPLLSVMVWFALTQSIEYWFLALGFWYGCRLLALGQLSLFDFFVAFMSVFYSGQATALFFQFSTSLTKGKNAANYLFWLHDLQPTVRETEENGDAGPGECGPLTMDAVRFSYPLRPETSVLRGVNLEIKKGQFAAFVGASGCGKSTMIAMLQRFYDPSSGRILVSSRPLPSLNPHLYRRAVSLVQQEPTLFPGSIRENIALGATRSITDADVEAALRAANAWDFVSSLPDGVHTPAGSGGGTQLSGGQRQRVAIARALVRDPRVLLLDEATSALDTASERAVQEALAEAARRGGDRITVAVAHRLSTIKDADVICVFYAGRIVEKGTHAELVALGGMYRKMCEAQNLD